MKSESGFSLAIASQPFRKIASVLLLHMNVLSVLFFTFLPTMHTVAFFPNDSGL